MVPAVSRWIPRVPRYSGFRPFRGSVPVRGCHPLRPAFPGGSGSSHFTLGGPTTPDAPSDAPGLGSAAFARRYSRYHCCFLFLRVLRCFSSPGSPPARTGRVPRLQRGGLPHSDTRGSRAICASPRIFAACHVLLRLRKPRHPPSALLRFSYVFSGEGDFIMSRLRSFVSRLLHFYGRHPPACPRGMPGGLPHLYPGRLTAPPPVHYVNDLYIARPGPYAPPARGE